MEFNVKIRRQVPDRWRSMLCVKVADEKDLIPARDMISKEGSLIGLSSTSPICELSTRPVFPFARKNSGKL
jgi:hypothetical protein